MKKVLTILSVALVALVLSSCVESSKKYQTLLAEKEALAVENQNLENEFNATIGIINEVENNLQAIRDAEGMLTVQQEGSERDQIVSELLQIKERMAENRARLDSLNQVIEKNGKNNANLRAQIKKLQAQIAEKEEMIAGLQAQIEEKDGQIANLNTQVDNLSNDLNNANTQIENLNNQNLAQTDEMNTVYYIGATTKELKEKGIILSAKKIFKGDVPTEEFTKADMRELNTIVFPVKKAVVLTTHPTESYTLTKGKDAEGNKIVTLEITNPEQFWKVTRYLVVLTK
jgi:predicted nuclease with TOPRIM domain